MGYCHLRRALRDIRADRILHLEQTGQQFIRPADFSIAEHLSARVRQQANTPPFTLVRLEGQPSAIAALWDHYYLQHCRVESSRRHAIFRLGARGYEEILGYLLAYGTDLEVLEPDTLRSDLSALARSWAGHHRQTRRKEPQLP